MMTQIEQNKSIALRFAKEGWGTNSNWQKIWDEVVATDIIWHHCALPAPLQGIEAAKKFNGSLFFGFPDMQQSIETMIAEDTCVAMRSFLGVPPTGKQITGTGVRFFRIAAGKIIETWYDINLLGFMQQIGLK
jgi:predicted ester cyclase